jgi:hypothetical protein
MDKLPLHLPGQRIAARLSADPGSRGSSGEGLWEPLSKPASRFQISRRRRGGGCVRTSKEEPHQNPSFGPGSARPAAPKNRLCCAFYEAPNSGTGSAYGNRQRPRLAIYYSPAPTNLPAFRDRGNLEVLATTEVMETTVPLAPEGACRATAGWPRTATRPKKPRRRPRPQPK